MKQLFIGIILLLAGGGAMATEPQRYPDVVSAKVQQRAPDTFDFDVVVRGLHWPSLFFLVSAK